MRVAGGELDLAGTPYFYFWRYFYESASEQRQRAVQDSVVAGIELELAEWHGQRQSMQGARRWYLEALLPELERYERDFSIYSGGSVVDCIALGNRGERRSFLDQYATDALHQMLATLRIEMRLYEPLLLKDLSDRFSAAPDVIAAMNPQLWTAVATMRFSALFRYGKREHPGAWAAFVKDIEGVEAGPTVVTPTVIWP